MNNLLICWGIFNIIIYQNGRHFWLNRFKLYSESLFILKQEDVIDINLKICFETC